MRTILISNDEDLLSMIESSDLEIKEKIRIYNESRDPLDVMSTVCDANPALLIVDDDFLAPDTVHILKSIRKVNPRIDVIFFTSNTSIELGKQITQLSVQYYAIKPLNDNELQESFKAAAKAYNKKNQPIIN